MEASGSCNIQVTSESCMKNSEDSKPFDTKYILIYYGCSIFQVSKTKNTLTNASKDLQPLKASLNLTPLRYPSTHDSCRISTIGLQKISVRI